MNGWLSISLNSCRFSSVQFSSDQFVCFVFIAFTFCFISFHFVSFHVLPKVEWQFIMPGLFYQRKQKKKKKSIQISTASRFNVYSEWGYCRPLSSKQPARRSSNSKKKPNHSRHFILFMISIRHFAVVVVLCFRSFTTFP